MKCTASSTPNATGPDKQCRTHEVAEIHARRSVLIADPVVSHTLRLSETKTRKESYLPSDEDSVPSRLQLMIYRKLLQDMLLQSFSWDN